MDNKKRISIILLMSPVLLLFAATTATDFAGTWSYSTATTEFQLILRQSAERVTGVHCSVQQNGNRVDCGTDNTVQSITGVANSSDSVVLSFKSFVSGRTGKAVVKKINPTTIDWRIIQKPQGLFNIPLHAVMKLQ